MPRYNLTLVATGSMNYPIVISANSLEEAEQEAHEKYHQGRLTPDLSSWYADDRIPEIECWDEYDDDVYDDDANEETN